MAILLFSFNAVAPLFIVISLGWFLARRGLLHEKERTFLNTLCFKYLLPIYIFSSVHNIDYFTEFNPRMFIVLAAGITIILILAWIIFTLIIKNPEMRCIYIVNSYRSNNLLYAMPIAFNLFGEAGLKTAAMLVPISIIMFNVYSVILMVHYARKLNKNQDAPRSLWSELKYTLLEVIKNPLIIGSASGVLLALSGIELPLFLEKGIGSLALASSPVSLLLLGSQIDFSQLKGSIGHSIASCLVRLVICPLIILPPIVLLGFRDIELSALAMAFSTPCAVATFIMARNYALAPQFAAQTVYLSTVISMFTIFTLITILRAFGLF